MSHSLPHLVFILGDFILYIIKTLQLLSLCLALIAQCPTTPQGTLDHVYYTNTSRNYKKSSYAEYLLLRSQYYCSIRCGIVTQHPEVHNFSYDKNRAVI